MVKDFDFWCLIIHFRIENTFLWYETNRRDPLFTKIRISVQYNAPTVLIKVVSYYFLIKISLFVQ